MEARLIDSQRCRYFSPYRGTNAAELHHHQSALKYQRCSFARPLFTESLFDLFHSAADAAALRTDRPEVTPHVAALASEHRIWIRKGVGSHFPAWRFGHNAASVAKVFTTQTDIFVLVAIHNGTQCICAKSSCPPFARLVCSEETQYPHFFFFQ